MTLHLNIPEEIAQTLTTQTPDLARFALESLALEAGRTGLLGMSQLRQLLGFETRMEVDAFLKEHGVYDYTVSDLEEDRETLRRLEKKQADARRSA
jgi:hypothetical protein